MRYLIVPLLLLAGCATQPERQRYWVKDGASAQDYNAETAQCRAQAFSVPGAMGNLLQVAAVQSACMEGKGWRVEER
jgi:uncharacterized lipoprotein YmbA